MSLGFSTCFNKENVIFCAQVYKNIKEIFEDIMADLFEATAPVANEYSANSIEVLEGLEPVRHRP